MSMSISGLMGHALQNDTIRALCRRIYTTNINITCAQRKPRPRPRPVGQSSVWFTHRELQVARGAVLH
jgi:hypothetical protein